MPNATTAGAVRVVTSRQHWRSWNLGAKVARHVFRVEERCVAHSRLPEVRARHTAAVEELATASQLGLVYTPLALADIPALANEVAELRRLYLTARGHLRDMLGDEAIERFGLGGTSPDGLPPTE
jgi:hypothetical protein